MKKPLRIIRNPFYLYRVARRLSKMYVPVLPSLISYLIRLFYSCWLPHTARIGKQLELGYGGLGCVVHSNATIGDRVHIGTGVSIGGNGIEWGTPVIGDDVFIGTGAKILGPISIGDSAIIGANAVVLSDVPPKCLAVGIPAKIVRRNVDGSEMSFRSEKQ